MSNQVGLMLSFVFVVFFILLSSEIYAYQQVTAKVLSITNQLSIYIEKNGYKPEEVASLEYLDYLDDYDVTRSEYKYGYVKYDISTTKKYNSFTKLYNYLSKDVQCSFTVYRKEIYV